MLYSLVLATITSFIGADAWDIDLGLAKLAKTEYEGPVCDSGLDCPVKNMTNKIWEQMHGAIPPWGARCLDKQDLKLVLNLYNDLNECGAATIGYKALTATWVFKQCFWNKGYTWPCSMCMGRFAFCSGLHCMHLCGRPNDQYPAGKNHDSPACLECTLNCVKYVMPNCAGFSLGKLPEIVCKAFMPESLQFLCNLTDENELIDLNAYGSVDIPDTQIPGNLQLPTFEEFAEQMDLIADKEPKLIEEFLAMRS